jgi:hypothetical protein
MYRIMLYCNQFPGSGFIQYDDESIEDIRKQRTAVLSEYSTNELLQLHSAVKFLRRIFFNLSGIGVFYFLCHSALVADAVPRDSILIDALLSTGPSGALRGWEARTYSVFEDNIDFELFKNDEQNPLFVGYRTQHHTSKGGRTCVEMDLGSSQWREQYMWVPPAEIVADSQCSHSLHRSQLTIIHIFACTPAHHMQTGNTSPSSSPIS